jgi:hypothetical protein
MLSQVGEPWPALLSVHSLSQFDRLAHSAEERPVVSVSALARRVGAFPVPGQAVEQGFAGLQGVEQAVQGFAADVVLS